MSIRKNLKALAFILSERQLGKTELLKRGLSNYDRPFIYVCVNKQMGMESFHGQPINANAKLISMDQLENLIGEHKPVIVDQEVVLRLCTDAYLEIARLEAELKLLKDPSKN